MMVVECSLRDIDVVAPVEHGSYVHRRESTISVELDHIASLPINCVRETLVQISVYLGVMQRVRRFPSAFEIPARFVPIAIVLHKCPHPHLLARAGSGRLPHERFVQLGVVFAFIVVQRGKVLGIHAARKRVGAWFCGRFCDWLAIFGAFCHISIIRRDSRPVRSILIRNLFVGNGCAIKQYVAGD